MNKGIKILISLVSFYLFFYVIEQTSLLLIQSWMILPTAIIICFAIVIFNLYFWTEEITS